MRLLIIRPEPGASASAARARAAGLDPVLLPFFAVAPLDWRLPESGGHDALLLTSANAVRNAGPGLDPLRSLPVFCVGDRTATAAKAAGLDVAYIGTSDGAASAAAAANAGYRRLLWLAGEDHRAIDAAPMSVDIIPVYASQPLALPPDGREIIGSVDAVALHSPRAAALFAERIARMELDRNRLMIAAFSAAIAEAAGSGWRAVAVATSPSDAALLSALAQCANPTLMMKEKS